MMQTTEPEAFCHAERFLLILLVLAKPLKRLLRVADPISKLGEPHRGSQVRFSPLEK